jgi:hypothetical protein
MTLQSISLSEHKKLHIVDTKNIHALFHPITIKAIEKTLEK